MVQQRDIDAQLRRIVTSPTFSGSPRSIQFLRFCVHHSAGTKALELKETTIAVEVFNRSPDYNPKSDPIVRVHARRVREKLDQYYSTEGNDDPIRIDIPKGGYVPLISRRLPSGKTDFSDWEEQRGASVIAIANQPQPPVRRASKILALILTILLGGLGVGWMFRSRATTPSRAHGLPQQLSIPGRLSDPSWSHNGSQLAFAVADDVTGITHVYIDTPGSGSAPIRLSHDEHAEMRPVWSPDDRRVAFLRSLDLSRFEIVCLTLKDGTTRSFGPFNTTAYVTEEHPALDWSPDGSLLLSTEQMSPSSPMRLVLLSVWNGERVALTSPPTGSTGDIDGKFSPDGKWVAFRRGGLGDLYVVSIQGEHERPASRLTFDMRGVRGIAWSDGGRTILFGTNRGLANSFGIWKIPMTGGTPQEVSPPEFDAVEPALSRSGKLVFAHRDLVTALMIHSMKPGVPDRALFASNAIDKAPALSPDGRLVAFVSTRGGSEQLWLGRVGDAAPRQVTHFQPHGLILFSAWSPDSSSVAFSFREDAATNIYIYSLVTDSLRQVTATHNRDIAPVFGADGKYIYYSSNDDGTSRIWRVRADGSEHAEPMFWEAVTGYLPSSDGKWMYLVGTGPSVSLVRINLQDGTSESVFQTTGSPSFASDIVMANGFAYVAVSTNDCSQADIYQISPDSKTAKVVTHLTDLPPLEVSGFTISPDGESLITTRTVRNTSSFYSEAFK